MSGEALARCQAVTRKFGDFTAVSEVGLEVRAGEIVGLLGANGAGKTTLIRLLLGLLPASSGEVSLFGEAPSRRTRSRLGYLPQGLGLYEDLSPAENMRFSAAVFGEGRKAGAPDGAAGGGRDGGALGGGGRHEERGGGQLSAYSRELVGSLPLGVQRRVAFAQALAHRPDLLILDEPTSGVDPLGRARLWETIAEAAEAGAGVLVTTHYMEEAGECDRLVIMADGRVVAEGTADQIIGSAQVAVVEAEAWSEAFGLLTDAGLGVALAGRRLRVPGADPAAVRAAVAGITATVREVPATLEERFFELTAAGAAALAVA